MTAGIEGPRPRGDRRWDASAASWWAGRRSGRRYAAAALAVMLVAALGGPAAAQVPPADRVSGALEVVVHDVAGHPISAAQVVVRGTGRQGLTDGAGMLRFDGIAAGTHLVLVRRLGFEPDSQRAEIGADALAAVRVTLSPVAQRLDAITVERPREVFEPRLEGFMARSQARASGYFITRERLDRVGGRSLHEVLREVPGVRIRQLGALDKTVRLRGAQCPPLVFIDGFPATADEFDLGMLDTQSLEGVEVYASMASIPQEFAAMRGMERCGVIAVWSRAARSKYAPDERPVTTRDVEAMVSAGGVFTASQVDRQARLDLASSPPVLYPDSLWRGGVGGRVLLELVVDASGAVEPGTVRIVSESHPALAAAARNALAGSRFSPAMRRGVPVRQIVQLPVTFEPAAAGSSLTSLSVPPPVSPR